MRVVDALARAADRPAQFRRRRVAQQHVDVLQVLAEQVIEQRVLGAGMIVAVPPEPVAALGDVQLLPGAQCGSSRTSGASALWSRSDPRLRFDADARASGAAASQAVLSSSWPIQMAKL